MSDCRTGRCKHDMVEGTCAICLAVPEIAPMREYEPVLKEQREPDSRYFVAEFTGWCRVCGESIIPGDTIRRTWVSDAEFRAGVPAQYQHEECP